MQHTSSLGGLRVALRMCGSLENAPSLVEYWREGADMPLDLERRRRKLKKREPTVSSFRWDVTVGVPGASDTDPIPVIGEPERPDSLWYCSP
jgi:hypothetical protein